MGKLTRFLSRIRSSKVCKVVWGWRMKFKVPNPPTDMFRFRNALRRSISQEVQQLPQGSIVVELYGDVDSPQAECLMVEHRPNHTFTAEELCLNAARQLKIGPLALHLFALTTPDRSQWFPPNEKIQCPETGHKRFLFRMRLKPHMNHLEGLTLGLEAFEYFFLQIRDDFVNDVLQGMTRHLERERILGLGVTDVHRFGKQEKLSMSEVQDVDPTRFIPKSVAESYKNVRKMLLKNGFKTELKKEFGSDVEPRKLKFQYIHGILHYMPSYAIESFKLKDEAEEKEIVVDPFHPQLPGIYLRTETAAEHVCDMKDILDISFWAEEARVQINRYDAMPRIFVFNSEPEARSFIALVDGYRRLTVDFYFHVTKDINSPTVEFLSRHRLHGPVSKDWARIQLQDYHKKNPDKNVNYLVRQRSNSIDNFILIFIRPGDSPKHVNLLMINQLPEGKFQIAIANEPIFENIAVLLRYYESGNSQAVPLKTRLGPSMVHGSDDSGLFLCKEPRILEEAEEELEQEVARQQMPTQQQQRSHVRIVSGVSLCPERIGSGQFTEVYKGFWNKDSKNIQAVAVKQLRGGAETAKTYQALMETVSVMSFWSNATIISILDICLHKFQMLEELAELGNLEDYLQAPHETVYIQHLVTAAEQISQALRYLQEECRGASSQVHGNIRCRNILVFDHNHDLLKVKLGDPGMLRLYTSEGYLHPYNLERLPWLAPELYQSVRNMTIHSDRYAFGITLWEIFSLGDRPFLHVRQEIVERLAWSGKCLDCPKKCPKEVYEVMTKCWDPNPPDRLGAKEIVRDIRNISQGMDRMVSQSQAESHYSFDNMGDLPEQAFVIMKHGRNDQVPSGSSDSTTALLDSDWSGATNLTPLLGTSNAATGPHGQEPDQPGIEYILKREQLKVADKILGQGFYGKVHIGYYGDQRVAVKSLRMNLQSNTRKEFEHEFKVMIKLSNKNIVNIIGQCPQRPGYPMLLVMEYVENGCLMNYLRERVNKIDPKTLLRFACEVAEGMYYLSSQKIVHRDLATRNVLVSTDITMKISDFGLSRLIDPHRNYYRCQRKDTEMPLKWCAPESLLYQRFSSQSDVWSYGITVWEIFKFGAAPILCEDKHIHTELYHGKRLPQPSNCPHAVYVDLMIKCWEYYANNRPQFQDLVVKAKEFMEQADLFLPQKGASVPLRST